MVDEDEGEKRPAYVIPIESWPLAGGGRAAADVRLEHYVDPLRGGRALAIGVGPARLAFRLRDDWPILRAAAALKELTLLAGNEEIGGIRCATLELSAADAAVPDEISVALAQWNAPSIGEAFDAPYVEVRVTVVEDD